MTTTTEIMRVLAWSLLHFVWQGAAIAAVAAALMFVFRKPATRYLVGIGALVLMLVSFGVTFALVSGGPNAPRRPVTPTNDRLPSRKPAETDRG